VFSFNEPFFGSMGGRHLNKPVVGIAAAPGELGYWEVASDGGVFAFGSAAFEGSMGAQAPERTCRRYRRWIRRARATGRSHPTAACSLSAAPPFHGSMGGKHLNAPIVGIAATSDGGGYWLVASDGGVFAFRRCALRRLDGWEATLTSRSVGIAATPRRHRLLVGRLGWAGSSATAVHRSEARWVACT